MTATKLLGIIVFLVSLIGTGIGVGIWQHGAGMQAQKVLDQKEFKRVDDELAAQKAEAAAILTKEAAKVIALQEARTHLNSRLEKEREKANLTINQQRAELAASRLWFNTSQDPAGGDSGGRTEGLRTNPAGNPSSQACQLSTATEGALKELMYEADVLQKDYNTLYDWAHAVRCSAP